MTLPAVAKQPITTISSADLNLGSSIPPKGWQDTSRLNEGKAGAAVMEENGIRFLRLTATSSGAAELASCTIAVPSGLRAYRVRMKARAASNMGLLAGLCPVNVPVANDNFNASVLPAFGSEWKDVELFMRGEMNGPQRFRFNFASPNSLDLASLEVTEIPASEYIPVSVIPTPRVPEIAARHIKQSTDALQRRAKIVFLGDSITHDWDTEGRGLRIWKEKLLPLGASTWGIGANRTEHILWQIQDSPLGPDYQPELFVILIGINNLFQIHSIVDIVDGMKKILAELQARCPNSRILIQGVFPVRHSADDPIRVKIRELNRRYAALADGKTIFYRDLGPALLDADGSLSTDVAHDGTHPTARGYEIWAEKLLPELKALGF